MRGDNTMQGIVIRESDDEKDIFLCTPEAKIRLPKDSFPELTKEDGPLPVTFIIKPKTGKQKRMYGVMKD
jgi:hypothetical protein